MAHASEGHVCGCAGTPKWQGIASVFAATYERASAGSYGTAGRIHDRSRRCVVAGLPGRKSSTTSSGFLRLSRPLGCWDEHAQCVYRFATAA